jgi:hypothetical protein
LIEQDQLISDADFGKYSNLKPYKIKHYKFKDSIDSKQEYIFIDKEVMLDQQQNSLKLVLDLSCFLKNEQELTSLPKFTYSIEEKDSVLLWSQVPFRLHQQFEKNAWNHLQVVVQLSKKDFGKQNTPVMKYYLLNSNKKRFYVKDVKLKVYEK